jgi:hypothetical protein
VQEGPSDKEAKQESATPKNIGKEIELFVNQIDALAESFHWRPWQFSKLVPRQICS